MEDNNTFGRFSDMFYSTDPLPTTIIPVNISQGGENKIYWNMIVQDLEELHVQNKLSSQPELAPYTDNDDYMLDCMEIEDNFEILLTKSGKFITSFYVPPSLLPVVVGAKGSMLKKLQEQTQTVIKVPRRNEKGNVKITGSTERNVASARTQITLMTLSRREKLDSTHFVSIPLISEEIKSNYKKFKDAVLNGPQTRGISENLFQKPEKLHLTIVVLSLLDESEIDEAKQLLKNYFDSRGRSLFTTKKKYEITLEGIEIMNDDPTEVDILYGKVKLNNANDNCLQIMSDEISAIFYRSGYVRRQYDCVKLHVTLMNSLFKVSTGNNKRESFDGSFLLESFKDFYFGVSQFNQVNLSIRFTSGSNGFYESALVVSLVED